MQDIRLNSIGTVQEHQGQFSLKLETSWHSALKGLEGFTHIHVLWWAHHMDTTNARSITVCEQPYKMGPEELGIFSTRSPARPNPIMITPVFVSHIDLENGMIHLPYIDAEPGSPILDIKPFHGSSDCIQNWAVPEWCSNWPKSVEESANFPWETVFNF
ncbi:MAG: TrmO family methyltransferase [Spirochaetales bacterium]|nr:TrmO family methyltransferase [Spirochaetales bacterium]